MYLCMNRIYALNIDALPEFPIGLAHGYPTQSRQLKCLQGM